MREQFATTPFGRRPVTLGQIAAQLQAEKAMKEAGAPGSNQPAAVHKWKLFRTITEARREIGVSDRALGVLNALLTFHPETALSLPVTDEGVGAASGEGEGAHTALVVFPSNRELSLRAHGVGERSLARHLASLIAAGLILRRDSPNGKRYARKARDGRGGFSEAFGFDLAPMLLRAAEFEDIAAQLKRERQVLQQLRERISLHRRDIAKMIECGLDEDVAGDWDGFAKALLGFSGPLRRVHDASSLAALERDLSALRGRVAQAIADHLARSREATHADAPDGNSKESGNAGHSDGHYHNSKTQSLNLEPASNRRRGDVSRPIGEANEPATNCEEGAGRSKVGTPLGMALDACPDIRDWAPDGLHTWSDFLAAARLLRSALGISPSAWRESVEVMGETDTAIAIASILQRHESSSDAVSTPSLEGGPPRITVHGSPAIASAGGYLRALTEKARAGEFSVGPLLMALIGQRTKHRRRKS